MSLRGNLFTSLPLCLTAALLMSGCSTSFQPAAPATEIQTPIGEMTGTVHGGQFPVSGAQIYLFAAATSGYAGASTSLITSGKSGVSCTGNNPGVPAGACYVTTDSGGNFSLANDYTCTAGTEVYMVASGGNPGILTPPAVNNTAIVQMVGLGHCPTSGTMAQLVPYLVINEVTTVSFAYAMGGFGTDAYHIGSSGTTQAKAGIANAMANSYNIVGIGWGGALPQANQNQNSVAPLQKINMLANILSTCVNTSSSTSTGCSNLFGFATNSAGTKPTDEATALFNIVHSPANQVQNIFNLKPSQPVFSPVVTAVNDWTLSVVFNSLVSQPATDINNQSVSGPFNIAFDASGSAWIGDLAKGVVKIGGQGTPSNPLTTPANGRIEGVAIDPVDQTIWAADYKNNAVYVMDSTGSILTTLTTSTNGPTFNGPVMTAFSGNTAGLARAFVVNQATAGVNLFDSGTYGFANYQTGSFGSIQSPSWISVDQDGSAWIPSLSSGFVGKVTVKEAGNSGNLKYSSSQTSGNPWSSGSVVDNNGDIWLADFNSSDSPALEEINNGNSTVNKGNKGPFTGGGLSSPSKLALDGANTIWVCNSAPSGTAPSPAKVSGFSIVTDATNKNAWQTGSWLSASGFDTGALTTSTDGKNTPLNPYCVVAAPDPSGNLWVANSDGSVTQLLGLAAPTSAPFYGGITSTNGNTTTVGNMGTEP